MTIKTKTQILKQFDFISFTFPALIVVACVSLIPFILNLYYALFEWNGISRSMKFVGIQNFVRIFTVDKVFFDASLFNIRFCIFYVVIVNILSLLIALFLAKVGIISGIARSCYYISFIISLVVVSFVWRFLFGPGFDVLYKLTGLSFFNWSWLGTSKLAFWSVLFVTIWQNVGFYMVIYIAGIVGIPAELMEAAEIDGSRGLNRFFCITFPLIMPSVTICIFASLTFAFKLFDIILVFTRGGPGRSTNTVAYNIYRDAFMTLQYGSATAKSLIFLLAILIITGVQLKFFKGREVEA